MAESLASRVQRLVSGSPDGRWATPIHSMPPTAIREALRELDHAAQQIRIQIHEHNTALHRATGTMAHTRLALTEATRRVARALDDGRNDLAQAAIPRQLDLEAQLPLLEMTVAQLSDAHTMLVGYLAAVTDRRSEFEASPTVTVQASGAIAEAGSSHVAGPSAVIDLATWRNTGPAR